MTPPYDRDQLVAQIADGLSPPYLFFWGHTANEGKVGNACFSQWYPQPFEVDGQSYATAEHFMMAEKAHLFGDDEARKRDPRVVGSIGGHDDRPVRAKL